MTPLANRAEDTLETGNRANDDPGTASKPVENPGTLLWVTLLGLPSLLLFLILYKAGTP